MSLAPGFPFPHRCLTKITISSMIQNIYMISNTVPRNIQIPAFLMMQKFEYLRQFLRVFIFFHFYKVSFLSADWKPTYNLFFPEAPCAPHDLCFLGIISFNFPALQLSFHLQPSFHHRDYNLNQLPLLKNTGKKKSNPKINATMDKYF